MSDTTHALNDFISLIKAGEAFYRDAAESVDHDGLKRLFVEMAAIRSAAIAEMSGKVKRADEDVSGASWAEQGRQAYTNAKALFAEKPEVLIEYLEEHEDRTLEQLRDALTEVEDTEARAILQRHLPIFQQSHDRMKAVKETCD